MPELQAPTQLALPDVEASLQAHTVDELKWFATLVGPRLPTRKGDLVELVRQVLVDPAEVRRLWDRCTHLQQRVIAEVVHTFGGRYDAERVEARCPGASPPSNARLSAGYGYGYVFGSRSSKKPATPYDLFFAHSYTYGRYIPSDLQALLKTFVPEPPPPELVSQAEPPQIAKAGQKQAPEVVVSSTEGVVFHDLAATLSLIDEGKIGVSASTRLPSLTSLRHLRSRLLLGDYFSDDYERAEDAVRPLALIMLVQAAKWAAPAGSGGKLELTKNGQSLLGAQLSATHVRDAWQRWLKTDLLDELSRIRAIKGQQAKGVRLTKPAERRDRLNTVLRICPPERWVTFDELLRYMRAEGLLPEIERNWPSGLTLGPYGDYGWADYGGARYWDIVTGSYLRALLWEYAATLGLVEIAYTRPEQSPHNFGDIYGLDEMGGYLSRYDGLLGLRLTNLGAYVLGQTTRYTPPAIAAERDAAVLRVLPNLDIVVTDPGRISPNDRSFLERVGLAESENVYRLSREHVLEATQHGLGVDQITTFLASRSGVAEEQLPQTVRVFLQELHQRREALRESGRMLLLESDDAFLLTELAHSTALRSIVRLATIDGRSILLVPEERETAVRRHLRKLGYAPKKG